MSLYFFFFEPYHLARIGGKEVRLLRITPDGDGIGENMYGSGGLKQTPVQAPISVEKARCGSKTPTSHAPGGHSER